MVSITTCMPEAYMQIPYVQRVCVMGEKVAIGTVAWHEAGWPADFGTDFAVFKIHVGLHVTAFDIYRKVCRSARYISVKTFCNRK